MNEIKLLPSAHPSSKPANSLAESAHAFRRARPLHRLHRYRTRREWLLIIALCRSGHACLERDITRMLRDL